MERLIQNECGPSEQRQRLWSLRTSVLQVSGPGTGFRLRAAGHASAQEANVQRTVPLQTHSVTPPPPSHNARTGTPPQKNMPIKYKGLTQVLKKKVHLNNFFGTLRTMACSPLCKSTHCPVHTDPFTLVCLKEAWLLVMGRLENSLLYKPFYLTFISSVLLRLPCRLF